ncbi:MAG TPA: hypothetical protein VHV30_10580 [Polyangiaceae bacterium]|jgi:hypothetical protein|nr:hypothetical protein [Polyangiaceae bacterium]
MNVHELVDELFEVFADRIGEPLGEIARDLPRTLALAPAASVPWSRVFSHEVTLGAPALFAEAMQELDPTILRNAVLAHLLAVIDAFGTDRIEDLQIEASPTLFAVLGQARRERDRAVGRIFPGGVPAEFDFRAADALTMRAIRSERIALLSGRSIDLEGYERAALDKQCAGIVASVALARAAGWSASRRRTVRLTLESISLALQLADDVVDWEDDLRHGGAWAVSLARGLQQPTSGVMRIEGADDPPQSIRERVLQSGVLVAMLTRAWVHMRRARRRAAALGARRLATWAASQEEKLRALAAAEAANAGYAVRAKALAAWACEVLA